METREIQLRNSDKVAIVDADLYDWLMGYPWFYTNAGYVAYSTTVNTKPVNYLMHRLVNETPKGLVTDHIDGNPLNNTRANLRAITANENVRRQGIPRDNTSGYKGVSWKKSDKCWQVKITVNNKLKHVGHFKDIHQAAKAYNEAALKHFGEFASLNEIKE